MKSRSISMAVLSACILSIPVLSFAAGQPKLHMPGKSEAQDLSAFSRPVQQGKGSGVTRYRSNPSRSEISAAPHPNRRDSAYRK